MTFRDVTLVGKKVLVGIIVAAVPLLILLSGLWLTRKLLDNPVRQSADAPRFAWRIA